MKETIAFTLGHRVDYYAEYKNAKEWHKKVCIMNLFHNTMLLQCHSWTLSDTAKFFDVSIGLVSENLKLAIQLDERPELMQAKSRQEALDMERRKHRRIKLGDNYDE